MSGKKIFQIDPENWPNQTTRERVVSERGRKELPPGTKGGENLKPDRHYEHKQYAFDSYCKKVLKCEACNGYRQISRHQNYYKYVNGQSIKYTVTPTLGMTQKNQPKIRYTLDFDVTPHQLRHTYITNLLYAGVDPKTVQYLAGHENSKTTMDIYAKVKYNKPEKLFGVVNGAFHQAIAE